MVGAVKENSSSPIAWPEQIILSKTVYYAFNPCSRNLIKWHAYTTYTAPGILDGRRSILAKIILVLMDLKTGHTM